jgi:hypothetical protein
VKPFILFFLVTFGVWLAVTEHTPATVSQPAVQPTPHVYAFHVVDIPLPTLNVTLHRYTRADLTTGLVCSMGNSFFWDDGEFVDSCWHQDGHKDVFDKLADEQNAQTK